ncbi:MAG: TonB-dependent receptor [Olivibacter sp.]|nr:TonB-dependent receptor [Olivibacter sp. UJ_SKK_5.1]
MQIIFIKRAVCTLLLLTVIFLPTTAKIKQSIYETRISLSAKNETVKQIIRKIETKIQKSIAYNSSKLDVNRKMSLEVKNELVEKVLMKLLEGYKGSVIEQDEHHIILLIGESPKLSLSASKRAKRGQSTIWVSGVVKDETGAPMAGVNVLLKDGPTKGITDEQGAFRVEVPDDAILLFRFIGYAPYEIPIGSQRSLTITLRADAQTLNEVVVVGYGAKRREEVIGAIASVPTKNLASRNINNTAEVLQGTVAGVTVINNGGAPTSSPAFKIRGIGSINDESPLLVVDGVVYSGTINSINPKDIESVSVLKDASAAIYGARASGGVILINTKKGSSGKPRVAFNYQHGLQQRAKKLEALNAAEFADVVNAVRAEGNLSPDPAFDPATFPDARTTKTVWTDAIFRTGKIYDVSGSVSAGSDRSSIFVSGGYRRNEGVLLNTYGDRFATRINSSFKLLENLTFGENMSYSIQNGQSANTTSAQEGLILMSVFYPPNAAIYREDGSGRFGGVPEQFPGSYGDVINPVAALKRLDINNPRNETLFNPYLEWNIIKGLKFRSNWSYTRIKEDFKQFSPKVLEAGKIFDYNELTQRNSTFTAFLNEQTLQYDKEFDSGHGISLLVGHTYEKWKSESFGVTATGFDNELEDLRYLDNSTQAISLGKFNGTGSETGLESYLGRFSYNYHRKYLLDASLRRDGTSKLTSANRWEWYPSVSVGWLLSKEKFLQDTPHLDNLKLRASWGTIGNLGILGNYAFSLPLTKTQGLLGESTTIVPGYAETQLSNPNLKWEKSAQVNVGLDASFFNEKLMVTVDLFQKTNRQMQLQQVLPAISGTPNGQLINAGVMRNTGIELNLTYNHLSKNDFSYSLSGNLAILKNELRSLYDGNTSYPTGSSVRSLPLANIAMVGQAFNSFYGYQRAGLFQSDEEAAAYVNQSGTRYQPNARGGDFKFIDTNGDGVLDAKDQQILGNPFPKLTFGLNGDFRYKSFDLNLFFQGVAGNDLFNAVKYTGLNASFPGYNMLKEIKNAWTPNNTNTDIPRISYTDANNNFGRISDFYIEDGSFLRLKSITLGYTLPQNIFKHIAPRFYFTAQNLFTITKYSGMDPEVGLANNGTDVGMYPLARVFMLGVDFHF